MTTWEQKQAEEFRTPDFRTMDRSDYPLARFLQTNLALGYQFSADTIREAIDADAEGIRAMTAAEIADWLEERGERHRDIARQIAEQREALSR